MPISAMHRLREDPARGATRALAVATTLALLAVTLWLAPLPATGQAGTVHSPTPAPHAVVDAGTHRLGAVVTATGQTEILLDGAVVEAPLTQDELGRTVVEAALSPGSHLVEVRVDGHPQREWPVLVSDVRTRTVAADPLALGRAASGPTAGRTVLLVNPDTPALAAAAGPLGAATGALIVPTGRTELPDASRAAIAAAVPDDGRVLLLGGLDAIGTEVADLLDAAGHRVDRVGTGSAAAVAAAAADRATALDLYRRGSGPVLRPVLVAPAEPPDVLTRAAALAASRGASLVLADGDELSAATVGIISARDVVWLSESLSDDAADAARAAAADDATITTLPLVGDDRTDHAWVVAEGPAAVIAARAADADTTVLVGAEVAEAWIARHRPAEVIIVGQAVDPATVSSWWVDGTAAPSVTATIDASGTPTATLVVDSTPQAFAVHVEVLGREWPGTTTAEGSTITWRAGARPQLPPGSEPTAPTQVPLVVTAVVAAQDAQRHLRLDAAVTIAPLSTTSAEGFLVAGGESAVVGTGPLRTFSIEIEPATGLDLAAVTAEATGILLDPGRGWTARGERSMQRVGSPSQADIRVVVARPGTVDAYCGRVGLNTGGALSCWDGRRAMLNLTRWNTGVAPFHTDLTVYRQYLVSHEVGHGLRYGHVGCPGPGRLAPVMMQQSKGLGGCLANGWPYPNS